MLTDNDCLRALALHPLSDVTDILIIAQSSGDSSTLNPRVTNRDDPHPKRTTRIVLRTRVSLSSEDKGEGEN